MLYVKALRLAKFTPAEVRGFTDEEWQFLAERVKWPAVGGPEKMNPPASAESKAMIAGLMEETSGDLS